jgi:hypothetical protein
MAVSYYGLTLQPNVFSSPPNHPAITTSTPYPQFPVSFLPFTTFDVIRIFHPMKKTAILPIFQGISGLFHPVRRLFLALKEATTSSECEA